ncbi:8723_t:CDS:2, partial [Rhizophagus irregularis]
HTTIKYLLSEEIKKIPGWSPNKYPGKILNKNGKEITAKKTIREYLYQYLKTRDSNFKPTTDKAEMTADELSEELGALLAIADSEVDNSILSKARNDPNIIAPIVGNRKVSPVCDDNTFIKMAKVGRDLRKEFGKKVPLSVTYPGIVDGKEYIIASVNLTEGTPVHNIPAEYKGFPLLKTLKPGISIGDAEIDNACTLCALFRVKNQDKDEYLLTVKHGVGDVDDSVIQPGKGTLDDHCARVKYSDLNIDDSEMLVDYAFCMIDEYCDSTSNKACGTEVVINSVESILDHKSEDQFIYVYKVGRESGHTKGRMIPVLEPVVITELFEKAKRANGLLVYGIDGKFGDHGDSGAPVYDETGALWGIYEATHEKYSDISIVIPIGTILES